MAGYDKILPFILSKMAPLEGFTLRWYRICLWTQLLRSHEYTWGEGTRGKCRSRAMMTGWEIREVSSKTVSGEVDIWRLTSVLGINPIDSCMLGKYSRTGLCSSLYFCIYLEETANRIWWWMGCGVKEQSRFGAWEARSMDGPFSETKQHSGLEGYR